MKNLKKKKKVYEQTVLKLHFMIIRIMHIYNKLKIKGA